VDFWIRSTRYEEKEEEEEEEKKKKKKKKGLDKNAGSYWLEVWKTLIHLHT